jgi:NRPS condensation-like uncharacterized protein
MWQFAKSLFAYYQDYQQDTQASPDNTRLPIVSGSAMAVQFKSISPECLTILNDLKQNVSLNTVLQVLVSEQLKRLNLQEDPITYTIPVDLRRYLDDLSPYCPSNLSTQIRVKLDKAESFFEQTQNLQNQINEQLKKKTALASIPGEWLLLLSGRKRYQSVNRDWLLKSTYNDPRIFVLSNLGNLDTEFQNFLDILADDFSPHIVVPLMGAPSLVFSFNTFCGQGNIALTYDPQLYSPAQVEQILNIFDAPKLKTIAQEIAN